jgi:ATP-binding cassette subfamily B protein
LPPKPPRSRLAATIDLLAYTRRTLSLVLESSPGLLLAMASATLVSAALPVVIAYAGKRIIDAVVAGDVALSLRWVLLELGSVTLSSLSIRSNGLVRSILGARLGVDLNVKILETAAGLELPFFENAEFYDKLTRARREASSRPVALIADSFQIVQNLLTLAGYAAVLSRFSGWLVLVLLGATVPAALSEMRFSRLGFQLRNWRSPETRRLLYLEYVLANDEHVKEVKLFGLGPHLLGRYRALSETFYREDQRLALRRAGWTQALSLLGTAAFYGAYALMAMHSARGELGLGTLTLYIVALRQGQQAFQSVLSGIGNIYEHNLYMSNLFDYFEIAARTAPAASRDALTAPASGAPLAAAIARGSGVVFENVSFRYPNKEESALRGLSLEIRPGESLAIVGQNGAGKTTLVKLLARLYQPTEGRILLDGIDLIDWPIDVLRRRISVLFQDFNQYQLSLRENIGLGNVDHLGDAERIGRAARSGGADTVAAALPEGLEARLGTWFEKGSELSGGQWQKIALSRAFMREEADILVLDEPTAALDAEAEHAVFARFRELSRGRTTIVISHRFPTVRMAQKIIVLEQGKLIEAGSHAELIAVGGQYAHMFALQAEGYR